MISSASLVLAWAAALIEVGRDLRVNYDDADVARAQPLHRCRMFEARCSFEKPKRRSLAPGCRMTVLVPLGTALSTHAGGCDAEGPSVDDVGRNAFLTQ